MVSLLQLQVRNDSALRVIVLASDVIDICIHESI